MVQRLPGGGKRYKWQLLQRRSAVLDIIKSRHSIRKYTDRQISREDLEKILEGRQLMEAWDVPQGYACQGFVILGYINGEQPQSKPRKPGRVKIIEA